LPLLDSLIKRLQNSSVHRCDHIHGSVKFFFGHARFPCIRKAAFHSGIAKPQHRHGQSHQHLFALAETGYCVRLPIERPEISFIHLVTPVIAKWAQHAAPLPMLRILNAKF
jgi:hypothetical protein